MRPEVSAILLAAGMSRRMGSCKQLLPLDGQPFIVHCIDSIMAAGIRDIVVVIGAHGDEVVDTIRSLPVTIVRNLDPESDMAASVLVGMQAVYSISTGVFVSLVDHPLVEPDTYNALIVNHGRDPESILIPVHEGKKGHPTLFPRTILDELKTSMTLRDIVHAHPERVRLVEVADGGVTVDIDTPEEYRKVAG